MTKRDQIYKCEICGNIIEVLHEGVDSLVCCNEPMKLLKENTVDAAKEKHVPIISNTSQGILVQIGSVPHPMEEKHYIEWIEIITKYNKSYKKFLSPGDKPEVKFCITPEDVLFAREHCNLHGLWKS